MESTLETCYKHPDRPAGVVCQRCDKHICPQCMRQASVGFHCPDCAKQGKQKVYQGVAALTAKPLVTQVLIGINVAVFLLGIALDGGRGALDGGIGRTQIDFGLIARVWQQGGSTKLIFSQQFPGTHGIGVGNGQVYRLVTSGFLHYGLIHLALNMYALWILGQAVEHLGGRLRFGLVYGVALLGGALGALVLSPDSFTAGGAAAGWLLFDYGRRPEVDKRLPFALCGLLAVGLIVAATVFASGYTAGGA